MPAVTTITPKYQVYIPVAVRRKIGLKQHGPAKIHTEGQKIVIEPLESQFLALGGKFRVEKPTSAEKIRSQIKYSARK